MILGGTSMTLGSSVVSLSDLRGHYVDFVTLGGSLGDLGSTLCDLGGHFGGLGEHFCDFGWHFL